MPDTPKKTVDDNAANKPVSVQDRTKNVENDNARPAGTAIDTVVVHADAGKKAAGTVSWIEDDGSDVSYHTFVERDGDVHRLVEPERRAWHAGVSQFGGRKNVNDFSLGISFANRNDGMEEYTELQYQIGAAEVASWMRKYPRITIERIVPHSLVATPAGRKTDPGPKFDMNKFKEYVQKTLDGVKQS